MALSLSRQMVIGMAQRAVSDPYKYRTPGVNAVPTLPVTHMAQRGGAREGAKVGPGTP